MFLDEKIILEIDLWLEGEQTKEESESNIVRICLDAIKTSEEATSKGIITLFKRIDNAYQLAFRTLEKQKKPHFLKADGFRELVRVCDGETVSLNFTAIRQVLK